MSFELKNIPGCHSCKYEEEFDTEREPCKSCYGLSHYENRFEEEEDEE